METVKVLKRALNEKQCKLEFWCGKLKQQQRRISGCFGKEKVFGPSDRNTLILELCCDMQWSFYPDLNLTVFSHNYKEITGWPRLIYENFAEVENLVHPQDASRVISLVKKLLSGRSRRLSCVFRYGCADNNYILLNSSCTVQKDENGKIVAVLGLSNLLTDALGHEGIIGRERLPVGWTRAFMRDYIWEYDLQRTCFSVSDQFMEIFQLAYNREFFEELQQLFEGIQGAAAQERRFSKVIRLRQPGEKCFLCFKAVYYAIKDLNGGLCKLIGTIRPMDGKDPMIQEMSGPN